jgi:hypothetical protein
MDGFLEHSDHDGARDRSIMRNHVLPRWGGVQLGQIDDLGLQTWVSELGERRSEATVTRCYLLASAVLRSAVRNRLVPFNPADSFKPLPKSAAGRRQVPLPSWLVASIREHLARWPTSARVERRGCGTTL